jgi:hypothetical protein
MCQRLQRSPGQLEGAVQQLTPVLTLNNLAYYSVEQETALDQQLRQAEAEKILGRPIPPEVQQ